MGPLAGRQWSICSRLSAAAAWHRLEPMKRSIRLFMLLLISLMLPINGMAQTLMGVGSSSASQVSESVASHASHGTPDGHAGMSMHDDHTKDAMCGNCSDAEHNDDSLVCKSGQECKTSSLLQVFAGTHPRVPPAQSLAVFNSDFLPTAVADAVWHPPRS